MKASVCLTLFNGERYVGQQISSILSELRLDDEVIVVNDCSPDSSSSIVNSFEDPRIKVVDNTVNLGVIRSIERAIQIATGDIIFLADQDDIWLPGKVETILEAFRVTKSWGIVSNALLIDSQGHNTGQTHFAVRNSGSGVMKNWWRNGYVGCCMAFDSKIKPLILPFPADIPMHDTWIGSVCDFIQRVEFIPEPLVAYRRHGTNSTELVGSDPILMLKKRLLWLKIMAQHFPRIQTLARELSLF
jgi:glycosyltransferase involved in cell wall biosynthesis